ncbi:glycosyltransferase [Mucilaginibacter sp. dw_454]|uniref:glycosyltransferase n=1 Tax=Mucilaginibacter sp. dw_454 TaxID=2720079 RepID=UPI001BD2C17B|nr:glycosyltransferase [Mucilaginibacter sp. dw_454]
MEQFNLCIIKPNKETVSETFVREHIERLPGNKKVLYGGVFPVFDDEGKYLIRSPFGLLSYLIQKKLFNKINIGVRTRALAKYLTANNIDVVFAEYGMVGASVTEACQLADVPLVIHYHGADVHHTETIKRYLDLYKKSFAYASALIAVSGDMAKALIELGAPAKKITNASCGIDPDAFPQLDISKTGRTFLSVGRFVEKKSPTSVVKAFKLVVDEFPEATLKMVGVGPLFDETKALVSQLQLAESVTLLGAQNQSQIKELLGESRCFVQHSVTAKDGDKEGTPVTILEAGSSGLAIVSTLHTGIKEAVVNGETGYLVPEHDIEGMARYMKLIAADVNLAVTLGAKEATYIRENYDIQSRIRTITKLLKQAIVNKKHD